MGLEKQIMVYSYMKYHVAICKNDAVLEVQSGKRPKMYSYRPKTDPSNNTFIFVQQINGL